MNKQLIILFLFVIILFTKVQSDSTQINTIYHNTDTLKSNNPEIIVKIGRMYIDNMDLYDTLFINLKSDGTLIAGFDFKIGIDNYLIDIVEILPGEIYDSCKWEYFNAHQLNTLGMENAPFVLWQMVALAEVLPDAVRPLCFGFEREANLMKIVLSNAHVMEMPDTTIPIFFYWEDCTDNTLSSQSGAILMISKLVRDYYKLESKNETAIFPNQTGAPHQCVDPGAINKPLRWIEFHNGGVEFEYRIDLNSADSTFKDSF